MKRLYYKAMRAFTRDVAWGLFFIDPQNRCSGPWWEASQHYNRKLSMLDHPSNG